MPETATNWPDVKATTIATGSMQQAAEQHGVSYEAVRQRASREKWPVGRRVHQQAQAAREAANTQMIRASQGRVTSVTSAADALSNVLLEDGNATKLAGMRYARRTIEAAAKLAEDEPLKALVSAGDVKASLQSAAIAGNWASSGSPSLRLTMFGNRGDTLDVEAEFIPE